MVLRRLGILRIGEGATLVGASDIRRRHLPCRCCWRSLRCSTVDTAYWFCVLQRTLIVVYISAHSPPSTLPSPVCVVLPPTSHVGEPSIWCLQQNRFSQMSDAIIGRVDEMSSRIDELEKSVQDLMVQVKHFRCSGRRWSIIARCLALAP